jgi:hypothetical protein
MNADSDDLHNSRTVVAADSPVTWFYPDLLDKVTKVKTSHIQVHKYGDYHIGTDTTAVYTGHLTADC